MGTLLCFVGAKAYNQTVDRQPYLPVLLQVSRHHSRALCNLSGRVSAVGEPGWLPAYRVAGCCDDSERRCESGFLLALTEAYSVAAYIVLFTIGIARLLGVLMALRS